MLIETDIEDFVMLYCNPKGYVSESCFKTAQYWV